MKLGIIVASTRPTRIGHLMDSGCTSALPSTASLTSSCSISPSSSCRYTTSLRFSNMSTIIEAMVGERRCGRRVRHRHPGTSLINAFYYVYKEWNYKPAGFVSYGGSLAGYAPCRWRSRPSRH